MSAFARGENLLDFGMNNIIQMILCSGSDRAGMLSCCWIFSVTFRFRVVFNYGSGGEFEMTAKIYRPAKTAMQSGKAKTHLWVLEFDQEAPRKIDPVMGYTSTSDMQQQVKLTFDTLEQAEAYAKRESIEYRVIQPKEATRKSVSYSENFRYSRTQPWTH